MLYLRNLVVFSSLLALTLFPSSAISNSKNIPTDIKLMGSVLSQADHYRIRGVDSQAHQRAIALYEQAAEQGSAVAQYWLGRMHFAGTGVEEDSDKAEEWLDLAAKQDYPPAKEFLFDVVLADEEDENGC